MLDGATRPMVACQAVLSRCPDPPSPEAVRQAHRTLVGLQALHPRFGSSSGGGGSGSGSSGGGITPLGRHLSQLPCLPSVGRILIYGTLLGMCSVVVYSVV